MAEGAGGREPDDRGPFWQLVHSASCFAYRLPEGMIFVGREECDVTVLGRSVDKRHAVIMFDYCDRRFKVKDLNSANGTFVNEERIPVQTYIKLDDMDLLRFGFDSLAYQVVRVPGPGELSVLPALQISAEVSSTRSEANADVGSIEAGAGRQQRCISPPRTLDCTTQQQGQERAVSEEPSSNPASGSVVPSSTNKHQQQQPLSRNLSAPLEMTAATSNSSLHSTFSEDSLLGDGPPGTGGVVAVASHTVTMKPALPILPPIGQEVSSNNAQVPVAASIPSPSVPESKPSSTPPAPPAPVQAPAKEEAASLPAPLQTAQLTQSSPSPPEQSPSVKDPATTPSPGSSSTEGPNTTSNTTSSSSPSSASAPPAPLHPMAFTVDFADEGAKKLDIGDSISKFVPKHRRNQSVSRQEEVKQQRENRLQQQLQQQQEVEQRAKLASPPNPAPKSPPVPPNNHPPCPAVLAHLRRAGYHSEGYFSSDQEEDLSSKTDISVRKAKAMDKAARATNLAQEKKTKPELASPAEKPSRSANQSSPVEKVQRLSSSGTERRAISLEESASEHFSRILGEQAVVRQASCGNNAPLELLSPTSDGPQQGGHESPADNVSEAGTYTIDKDSPSPEESRARSDIDAVFGVAAEQEAALLACDTRTFTRPKALSHEVTSNGHDEPAPKIAGYRGGPNWIKEWAAQVAEQNSLAQQEVVLPPISRKGRVPSPCRTGGSPLQSPSATRPAAVMGWPPPPKEPPPNSVGNRGRHKLPALQNSSPLTSSDLSDPTDSPVRRKMPVAGDRHTSGDIETESYLRTTESVVTAMQARMTGQGPVLNEEESEEEEELCQGTAANSNPAVQALTSQLRAKLRALEQKASKSPSPGPAPLAVRRLVGSGASGGGRQREEGRASDSSSEAGDHKPRMRERADSASASSGPQTRYNRAFSLRRARLDADEAEKTRSKASPIAPSPRATPPRTIAPVSVARTRKLEPSRPVTNSTASKPPSAPSATGNFSRADGGRFSLRAGKVAPGHPPNLPKGKSANARKEPQKKNNPGGAPGGRSNSNLHSRETEFQNWKRRKSYDPMKAAAEGKKKAEAARKAVHNSVNAMQDNIMTQSAIVMTSHVSPNTSPLNSILRSASFHGTGGMARPGAICSNSSHGSGATSEDEATLSADEDLQEQTRSPLSPRRLHQHRARPSPLPPHPGPAPLSPLRAVSQPPDHTNSHSRKSSLDETMDGGARGFIRNTTPTSSVRSRGKLEVNALDNLVIAAIHGFSNKIKGSSHNVLSKLRVLFQEDPEKATMLEDTLSLLEEGEPATSSPSKSPSKELSGTLRNLKKLEHVFTVLDEVLFGEDEDLVDELEGEEDLELSDLEADHLAE